MRCEPPEKNFDNDFHEVWWNSVADGWASKGKPKNQLQEIWQWLGDAPEPKWHRPGFASETSAEEAYAEGWRYVRKIELTDEWRMDGTAPYIDKRPNE